MESERKFPQDSDHIFNDVVALVAKLLKVGKGISIGADFAGEKFGCESNVPGSSRLLLAFVFGRPCRLQSLTKDLRNGGFGEFGKCRNHAVGRGILQAQYSHL